VSITDVLQGVPAGKWGYTSQPSREVKGELKPGKGIDSQVAGVLAWGQRVEGRDG